MKKFCYKCGKITDDLEDGLCKECKEIITKTVELTICSKCGKIKEGKVWKNKTIENAIKKYNIKSIISIKGYSSKLIDHLKNKYNLKVYYLNPCIFGNSSSDYIIIMLYNLKIFKKVLVCGEE